MDILILIDNYEARLTDSASDKARRGTLPSLRDYFGERTALEIEDFADYHQYLLHEKELSPPTCKAYVSNFKRMLTQAVAQGDLDGTVLVRMNAYYDTMRDLRRAPTLRRQIDQDDIEAILEAFADEPQGLPRSKQLVAYRNRALVFVLAGSGLRISEALSLDRWDFDKFLGNWNGKREMVTQIVGKGQKVGMVIILPFALAKIKDYLDQRGLDGNPPLFIGHGNRSRGNRLGVRAAEKVLEDASQELGLSSFTAPHAFRHFFAERLAESEELSLSEIQDALRHADPRTTKQSYTGVTEARRLARKIGKAGVIKSQDEDKDD